VWLDKSAVRSADRNPGGCVRSRARWPAHPATTAPAGCPPALDQRIAVRYQIGGMSAADTTDYIRHHCKFAGRSDTLFSDDAIG
jgi:hypothetical protein